MKGVAFGGDDANKICYLIYCLGAFLGTLSWRYHLLRRRRGVLVENCDTNITKGYQKL